MKTFIKIGLAIVTFGLCIPSMAADRFIIKYKLNESQTSFLLAHSGTDKKEAKELIREQMMERLSHERINSLSKAAGVQAQDSHSMATGAHVIILSKHLDEKQTEQFIHNVKQDSSVEYIEEDKIMQVSS